jgi:hypothetical protein
MLDTGQGRTVLEQAADPAAPSLPLIVNRETVDPRDPASIPMI